MRRIFYISVISIFFLCLNTFAQEISTKDQEGNYYYPGAVWEEYVIPGQVGFDDQSLLEAKDYYDSLNASSVLVIYKGKILLNWGDNTRRLRSASVRKSFLHALLGIANAENKFDLEDELGTFKVEEFGGLNDLEKTTKIKYLMSSTSGVYLPAAYEAQVWTDKKPERGSQKPGSKWYYNNWDFNALGTIYDHVSGGSIAEDFNKKIAIQIGMQDFRPELDFKYFFEKEIAIPAYLFKMSARDMARFGLLYLRYGKWKEKQIVSREWVEMCGQKISTPWSDYGYGYLWWNTKTKQGDKIFYASGTGVQGIYVVPDRDLIMVFRSDTYLGPEVNNGLELELLNKILEAQSASPQKEIETRSVRWDSYKNRGHNADNFKQWIGEYQNNITRRLHITMRSKQLVLTTKIADFLMFPLSDNTCWIEDLNITAEFIPSDDQKYSSLLTKDKLILYY